MSVAKLIVLLQEIELVFKPHPKDHDPETVAQQTRYIKTTANASGKSLNLLTWVPTISQSPSRDDSQEASHCLSNCRSCL